MADPLEEYLSRKKGVPAGTAAPADPLEAYLASKAPNPVVSDAQINRFPQTAASSPSVNYTPEEPGVFSRSIDAIVEGAKSAGRAGQALVHDAGQRMAGAFGLPHDELPQDVRTARVHQMLRGFGNAMTAGHERDIEQFTQPNGRFRTLVHLAGQRAAGAFGLPHEAPPTAEERAKLLAYPGPSEGEQNDQALAPDFRQGTEFVSSFLPNPITKAAGALGGPLVDVLDKVPAKGIVQNAIMGAAKGAANYIPPAVAYAAATPGATLHDVVGAATNPVGLGIAMGGGAIGGGAKGFGQNIRDPLTQSGRDLQAIEAVNGEVRPFGEPARGGEFESQEMQNLPKGRAGRHELAAKSVDRVLAANDEQYHAAQEAWGNTADQVLADHGDETHFATKTHDVLDKLEQDNTVNGVVGDEKLAGAIKKARAMLQAPEGESPGPVAAREPPADVKQLLVLRAGAKSPMVREAIDAQIKAAGGAVPTGSVATGNPAEWTHEQWKLAADDWNGRHISDAEWERAGGGNPAGKPESATSELGTVKGGKALPKVDEAAYAPTEQSSPEIPSPENATGVKVADFIKSRKILNQMARNTQDPSERYAFGKILDAMKADAADIDPRIGQLNADYAKQMQSLTATNDALFGQAKPVVKVTEGVKQSAAARMDRIGEDTKPGMRAEPRMQRFAEARPSNAREAALNRAKQAAERLRYGEPQTSTGFEQSIARGAHKAAASKAGATIGAILGHGPVGRVVGAIAGFGVGKLAENLPQARVRIGLPVSEAIARNVTGSTAVPANRIMELSRARREEDKKRANAVLNGAK